MANFPQLDDTVGVWKLKEVNNAIMGGYWRLADPRGGRGIVGGAGSPSDTTSMDYVNITSAGNAAEFGPLTVAQTSSSAFSSFTRGVFSGGSSPGNVDTQEYCSGEFM